MIISFISINSSYETQEISPAVNHTFGAKITIVHVHMRTHTGEKTYTFTQCGEAYSNKGNIHKHMKTYIGKKQCQCRQYEKVFSYKFDLDSHMRTHAGEKPYQTV